MRRSAWERAVAFASSKSCSPFSLAWWKTPPEKHKGREPHRAPSLQTVNVIRLRFVPSTHSERRQLLFINVDDVGDARVLHAFLQLPTQHQTLTYSFRTVLNCPWQNSLQSRSPTSKPFCIFSARQWTFLLESPEESGMVDGGTSCTATRLMDSSASLCR